MPVAEGPSTNILSAESHLVPCGANKTKSAFLVLFWLFLFRFRNNRIHGISISKRTLIHSENGILMAEVTWELHVFQPEARHEGWTWQPRWISRQKFPKRTRILPIPSKPYSVHSVHSAIASRMNEMIFRSFRKRNSSQKNRNAVYTE